MTYDIDTTIIGLKATATIGYQSDGDKYIVSLRVLDLVNVDPDELSTEDYDRILEQSDGQEPVVSWERADNAHKERSVSQ
jgi:hypothetical protein